MKDKLQLKYIKLILLRICGLGLLIYFFSCKGIPIIYSEVNKMQDNTVQPWKIDSVHPQKIMFIFPHPDDEITCAGTIAAMQANNWEVYLLTLTKGTTEQDQLNRTKEWESAVSVLQYDKSQLADFYNNSWDDIMQNNIQFWPEHFDEIRNYILNTIQQWQPDILVTYDDAIGGYGHPEHKWSAAMVKELFYSYANAPDFTPVQLFQMTLPQALETFLVSNLPSYTLANTRYQAQGLPDPDYAVDIQAWWPAKTAAATCYTSQRDILTKFYLLPSNSDTAKHYSAFNKEYYLEIKR